MLTISIHVYGYITCRVQLNNSIVLLLISLINYATTIPYIYTSLLLYVTPPPHVTTPPHVSPLTYVPSPSPRLLHNEYRAVCVPALYTDVRLCSKPCLLFYCLLSSKLQAYIRVCMCSGLLKVDL